MSCESCRKIQEITLNENQPIAYVRIENGNVAIVGCEKHLKILINKLREKK